MGIEQLILTINTRIENEIWTTFTRLTTYIITHKEIGTIL